MDAQQTIKTEKTTQSKKSAKRDYVYAVGRQKEAVARVRLYANVKEDAKWGGLEKPRHRRKGQGCRNARRISGGLQIQLARPQFAGFQS